MWIFTSDGFFSVVCARKDNVPGTVDPKNLMVRARKRKHLKRLKKRFKALRKCEIHQDAGTDYAFRIFVRKSVWVDIAAQLAADIDYGNFKNSIKGMRYKQAASNVWGVMYDYQLAHDDESSDSTIWDELFNQHLNGNDDETD